MRVMMNEEDFIKSKMGTRNPFVVPDGYFDQLTAQVMQKINAEEEKKTKKAKPAILRTLRPLLYAAACTCIALFGVATYQHLNQEASESQDLQSNIVVTSSYSDSYFEECADYAMLDNDDIYASLLADM